MVVIVLGSVVVVTDVVGDEITVVLVLDALVVVDTTGAVVVVIGAVDATVVDETVVPEDRVSETSAMVNVPT